MDSRGFALLPSTPSSQRCYKSLRLSPIWYSKHRIEVVPVVENFTSSKMGLGSGHFWSSCFFHAIVCVSFLSLPSYEASRGNETDRLTLLEFKTKITDDPFGIMDMWNQSVHFCQWHGVLCGRRHQRVTSLSLRSLKLAGTITPHIGNLSFLKVLDLTDNSFRGEIPPQVGHLRRLQQMYLYNNSLGGRIPANISSCSHLTSLSLVNNELVGGVPMEIGSLSKLQFLSISKNNLGGSLPPHLGNLSSLGTLSAVGNNFVGNIPDSFGQLTNLTFLGLSVNQLSGLVPSSIYNLSSIKLLDIGDNRLQGSLPSDLFFSLPRLQVLAVALNEFTGSIPISLSNASNLEDVQLQGCNLTGKVPSLQRLTRLYSILISANRLGTGGLDDDLNFLCSLTNASSLERIVISTNNFGGALPECIGNLSSNLGELSMQNNQISGSLPTGVENLFNLMIVQAWNNMLSGIIPQNLGNLQNLVILILDQNRLSGPIPSSLGNLTRLNRLHMADNDLQGVIPSSLGHCTFLQVLDVSRNNLSGTLPPEVIGLSSLAIYVGFAQNHLTGSLPTEVGNLKNLGILDVSDNMFSGEIPSTIGGCIGLQYLYMQGNRFQGPIPSSLGSLRGLQVMNFSHNLLYGQIPDFLASFYEVLYLDLSFNDFEGMVPNEGAFKNASVTFLKGNNKLCGGIPEFHLPACNFRGAKNRRMSVKVKVIIAAVTGLVGITLGLTVLLVLWLRKKSRKHPSALSENLLLEVSYRDLHKATNGFSSQNLIGTGSFGSVYKGVLHEGGPLIAVKVLNLRHRGAARSFMAECKALRNIRHRNLVKVLTACSSTDFQGNDFKALVFEFMPNGNLEEWLHSSVVVDGSGTQVSPKNLNLIQRLNIAIDVACALEYLHCDCETPIVHCDLKPSNVLLDHELTGHLGDFGLAKFLSEDISNFSANQSSSIGVRGTIGYAPPEYGLGSEVSTQGDVYSYGILLLEMFTGRRPIDEMFKDGWNLHKFAKSALPDGVDEIADTNVILLREVHVQDSSITGKETIEHLASIIEVGVACSSELPGERMSISDAARRLSSIRDKLLASSQPSYRERKLPMSSRRSRQL